MILVTVGMHTSGFPRLVRAADEFAAASDEEIVIQAGSTTYQPRYAAWFQYASASEMRRHSQRARVVVCQGSMSALVALEGGTPVIIVPRLKRFQESIDDHQVEHAIKLEELLPQSVRVVLDVDQLRQAIRSNLLPPNTDGFTRRRGPLIGAVREFVDRRRLM